MQPLVSSDVCKDVITCPGGNCVGCKNGVQWCSDSRCAPHCTECFIPPNNDTYVTMVFLIIIFGLLFILFMFIVAAGHPVAQKYTSVSIYPVKV